MNNNLININNNINNVNITNNHHNQNITMNINSLSQNIKCNCSKSGCRKKYCICYSKGKSCQECDCQNCENKPKGLEQYSEKLNNANSNNSIYNHINNSNQRLSCNCTKSNCLKKYCECYKQGISCNSYCRCILCNNTNYNNNNNNNKITNEKKNNILENENNNNIYINKINNNNLSNSQNFGIYHFHEQLISKNKDFKNPIHFQFEAFEVYLKKEKLKIDKRKINLSINSKNVNKNNNEINYLKEDGKNKFNLTPKFSKKKRERNEEDNSNMRTCPNTNSLNKKVNGLCNINKNIKKKKLQL